VSEVAGIQPLSVNMNVFGEQQSSRSSACVFASDRSSLLLVDCLSIMIAKLAGPGESRQDFFPRLVAGGVFGRSKRPE